MENIQATLAAGTFKSEGNASFGAVVEENGVAMEAAGLRINGGGFASASADFVSVRYNNTGTAYTDHLIEIGGNGYAFNNLPASTNPQKVRFPGLTSPSPTRSPSVATLVSATMAMTIPSKSLPAMPPSP